MAVMAVLLVVGLLLLCVVVEVAARARTCIFLVLSCGVWVGVSRSDACVYVNKHAQNASNRPKLRTSPANARTRPVSPSRQAQTQALVRQERRSANAWACRDGAKKWLPMLRSAWVYACVVCV